MAIFLQSLNYLIDAYLIVAASAIAANTFLRSLAGAGFLLFARQMILGMGTQWAGTLLGCVAIVLIPVPICFTLGVQRFERRVHLLQRFQRQMQQMFLRARAI